MTPRFARPHMTDNAFNSYIDQRNKMVSAHRHVMNSFGDKVYVRKFRPGVAHYDNLVRDGRLWFVANAPVKPKLAMTFTSYERALAWAIRWADGKRSNGDIII